MWNLRWNTFLTTLFDSSGLKVEERKSVLRNMIVELKKNPLKGATEKERADHFQEIYYSYIEREQQKQGESGEEEKAQAEKEWFAKQAEANTLISGVEAEEDYVAAKIALRESAKLLLDIRGDQKQPAVRKFNETWSTMTKLIEDERFFALSDKANFLRRLFKMVETLRGQKLLAFGKTSDQLMESFKTQILELQTRQGFEAINKKNGLLTEAELTGEKSIRSQDQRDLEEGLIKVAQGLPPAEVAQRTRERQETVMKAEGSRKGGARAWLRPYDEKQGDSGDGLRMDTSADKRFRRLRIKDTMNHGRDAKMDQGGFVMDLAMDIYPASGRGGLEERLRNVESGNINGAITDYLRSYISYLQDIYLFFNEVRAAHYGVFRPEEKVPAAPITTYVDIVIDRQTGKMYQLNLGHPSVLIRRGGQVIDVGTQGYVPLGGSELFSRILRDAVENRTLAVQEVQIEPDDELLFRTDGVDDSIVSESVKKLVEKIPVEKKGERLLTAMQGDIKAVKDDITLVVEGMRAGVEEYLETAGAEAAIPAAVGTRMSAETTIARERDTALARALIEKIQRENIPPMGLGATTVSYYVDGVIVKIARPTPRGFHLSKPPSLKIQRQSEEKLRESGNLAETTHLMVKLRFALKLDTGETDRATNEPLLPLEWQKDAEIEVDLQESVKVMDRKKLDESDAQDEATRQEYNAVLDALVDYVRNTLWGKLRIFNFDLKPANVGYLYENGRAVIKEFDTGVMNSLPEGLENIRRFLTDTHDGKYVSAGYEFIRILFANPKLAEKFYGELIEVSPLTRNVRDPAKLVQDMFLDANAKMRAFGSDKRARGEEATVDEMRGEVRWALATHPDHVVLDKIVENLAVAIDKAQKAAAAAYPVAPLVVRQLGDLNGKIPNIYVGKLDADRDTGFSRRLGGAYLIASPSKEGKVAVIHRLNVSKQEREAGVHKKLAAAFAQKAKEKGAGTFSFEIENDGSEESKEQLEMAKELGFTLPGGALITDKSVSNFKGNTFVLSVPPWDFMRPSGLPAVVGARLTSFPAPADLELKESVTSGVWRLKDKRTGDLWYLKADDLHNDEKVGYLLAEVAGVNTPSWKEVALGELAGLTVSEQEKESGQQEAWAEFMKKFPVGKKAFLLKDVKAMSLNDLTQPGTTGIEETLVFLVFTGASDIDWGHNVESKMIEGVNRYILYDLASAGFTGEEADMETIDAGYSIDPRFLLDGLRYGLSAERINQAIERIEKLDLEALRKRIFTETGRELNIDNFKKSIAMARGTLAGAIREAPQLRSKASGLFSLNHTGEGARNYPEPYSYTNFFLSDPSYGEKLWKEYLENSFGEDAEFFREMIRWDRDKLSKYAAQNNPYLEDKLLGVIEFTGRMLKNFPDYEA
ncbi:MAG: SpoIIE family protein phosphatase, partial [Candidatus Omnitrophota bacterium]